MAAVPFNSWAARAPRSQLHAPAPRDEYRRAVVPSPRESRRGRYAVGPDRARPRSRELTGPSPTRERSSRSSLRPRRRTPPARPPPPRRRRPQRKDSTPTETPSSTTGPRQRQQHADADGNAKHARAATPTETRQPRARDGGRPGHGSKARTRSAHWCRRAGESVGRENFLSGFRLSGVRRREHCGKPVDSYAVAWSAAMSLRGMTSPARAAQAAQAALTR